MTSDRADDLLAGPRGRRVCWAVADEQWQASQTRFELLMAPKAGVSQSVLTSLRNTIRKTDLTQIANSTDEITLLNFVADSVGSARYWQDPDEIDQALADPGVTEELRPIAQAISSAPASAWWSSELARSEQVFVDYRSMGSPPPPLRGARAVLRNWKQRELTARAGGTWWSPPIWLPTLDEFRSLGEEECPRLSTTTRRLPNLGAVGLLLEEDSIGDAFAACWPVRCQEDPRVCVVNEANKWIELTECYPLEVTPGHKSCWQMATGLDSRWFLPDWTRVADDFDAVHLTVSGYLSFSGRPLPLGEGKATFLGGWDPDKTYWLADMLELSGPIAEWEGTDRQPTRAWRLADPETD